MFFKILWMVSIFIGLVQADVEVRLSDRVMANATTTLVQLYADTNEPRIEKIYAAFEGKRYPFYKDPIKRGRNFYALIPTSYYAKPHKSRLVVVYVEDGKKFYRSFDVDIIDGNYKKEILKVAKSKAQFSPQSKARIKKEAKEARKIYQRRTPTFYPKSPFAMPLPSKVTSHFGNRRLFNNRLKSFHSGTDFRAPTGTPIKAVADGRVVLAKSRFFAGNSVIIDHGEGIYTGYYHLSKFRVKKGDWVKKGEVVGLAGATGRVTGPHLHFCVHVHGKVVDPMHFLERVNLLWN